MKILITIQITNRQLIYKHYSGILATFYYYFICGDVL